MGGNVFTQDFKVLPLQLDSLSSFTENIKHILDEFKLVYKFPKYFRNKVTFNDLDIICDFTNAISKTEMIDYCAGRNIPIQVNSPAVSMLIDNHQVDLIETVNYDFSSFLIDYGDTIVYIKRLLKNLNHDLTLNTKGLEYKVRFKSTLVTVFITDDVYYILNLLDLDYQTYLNGFDSVNDVFEWIYRSKYFNSETMSIKNCNSRTRQRLNKRPSTKLFEEFLENKPKKIQEQFDLEIELPLVIDQGKTILNELQFRSDLKAKLNGRVVLKLFPDFPVMALKAFLRNTITKYQTDLLTYTQDQLNTMVTDEVHLYLKNSILKE